MYSMTVRTGSSGLDIKKMDSRLMAQLFRSLFMPHLTWTWSKVNIHVDVHYSKNTNPAIGQEKKSTKAC